MVVQDLYREAHIMTKKICDKYDDIDYKIQFQLCLAYLSDKEISKRVEEIMSEVNVNIDEARLLESVEHYYNTLFNTKEKLEFRIWKRQDKKRAYITSSFIKEKTYIDLKSACLYDKKLIRKF